MTPETEVLLIAALDNLITQVDSALDELMDNNSPEAKKAEHILLNVTIELNHLIDRISDESEL